MMYIIGLFEYIAYKLYTDFMFVKISDGYMIIIVCIENL